MRPTATFLLVVTATMVFYGCAPKYWTKPGATATDFRRDSFNCAQQSKMLVPRGTQSVIGFPSYEWRVDEEMYRQCLRVRGYQQSEDGQWEGVYH